MCGAGESCKKVVFKLKSESAAIALFRAFTEIHTFFNCNSVKNSVIEQTTRTGFGKLVTMFNSHSNIGERFLFDIIRTRRQAYSHACPVQSPLVNRRSADKEDMVINITKKPDKFTMHENLDELSMSEIKKIVRDLEDSRICQICMDEEVAMAFCPCGHVVCCVECSVMCRECPICRSQITYAQRVFFSCE